MKRQFFKKVILCVSMGLCALMAEAKSKNVKVKIPKIVILDYQDKDKGEIPQWVIEVASGNYSEKALSKVLPQVAGKKIFAATAYGADLAYAVQDAYANVADLVMKAVELASEKAGKDSSSINFPFKDKEYLNFLNTLKDSGSEAIEKAKPEIRFYNKKHAAQTWAFLGKYTDQLPYECASFWNKTQKLDASGKPLSEPEYTYCSIWVMDHADYEKMLSAILKEL